MENMSDRRGEKWDEAERKQVFGGWKHGNTNERWKSYKSLLSDENAASLTELR